MSEWEPMVDLRELLEREFGPDWRKHPGVREWLKDRAAFTVVLHGRRFLRRKHEAVR
jgi:hypothetical protein